MRVKNILKDILILIAALVIAFLISVSVITSLLVTKIKQQESMLQSCFARIRMVLRNYRHRSDSGKLQVNMANIRKKFGVKPGEVWCITNELGVGYRMNGDKEI